jgi:hypothetical protein
MAVKLSPYFQDAQLDSNGDPAVGWTITSYTAGSTTPQATYQDANGNTAHANPLTLNARGEPSAPIWLTAGVTYDLVLKNSSGSIIRTVEDVTGVNDTTTSVDQWVSGPTPTYVTATSFTVAGDQTATFTAGRRLKTTNTAGTIYSTVISSAYSASTTVTVENDSGTLDSGLSAVSYGLLSPDSPSVPQIVALNASRLGVKNRIIGGDFSTNPWQRGTTFTAPSTAAYTADRFAIVFSNDGVRDILKTADAPTAAQIAAYHSVGMYASSCLHHDVTTADATIAAAQYEYIQHKVEGYNVADLGFGQTGTRYMTLSFWVKATITGTYCICLTNSAADRRYVMEYTVSVADTWEYKTKTFAVDTTGTWLYTAGIGLDIRWILAAGSNANGATANTWTASSAILATSSQANALSSASNNFKLALVQLEAGAHSTAFDVLSSTAVQSLCERYFQKSFDPGTAPAQNTASLGGLLVYSAIQAGANRYRCALAFRTQFRGAPTMTFYNPSAANAKWRNVNDGADSGTADTATFSPNVNHATVENPQVAGDGVGEHIGVHWSADAEL